MTDASALHRALELIVNDPEIMCGDPVFRGTRVQVHMIAELIAKGETVGNLREDYPRLTEEMIRLAPVYAAAYPPWQGPRKQPWHDRPPVTVTRMKLADLKLSEPE